MTSYYKVDHIYHPRTSPPSRDEVITATISFLMRDDVEKFVSHPYYPASGSGITIGFGYDLRFHTTDDLASDWADLSQKTIERLSVCCNKKGSAELAKALRDVAIPKDIAAKVAADTVAKFYDSATKVFPGIERLPIGVQVALTSIVFNRGSHESLHQPDSMTRWERVGIMPWREMRFIQDAVRTGNLFDLYDDVRAMSRVWIDTPIEKGMRNRRELEAEQIIPYISQYQKYMSDIREFPQATDWRDYLTY